MIGRKEASGSVPFVQFGFVELSKEAADFVHMRSTGLDQLPKGLNNKLMRSRLFLSVKVNAKRLLISELKCMISCFG